MIMSKDSFVNIEFAKGNNGDYIIKDNFGITIGRINIVELSKEEQILLC